MAGEIKVSILLAAAIVSIVAVYHVLSARFPDDYGDITAMAAERYGVDEPLVRAVILVESGYREDAVSGAGAEGLMQLMPATRAEVSAKSGVPDDGSPRSEILMGTYYLRSMLDLTGNVRDALAAYNAGPGRLAAWKRCEGEMYPETRAYIDRVLTARRIYSLL